MPKPDMLKITYVRSAIGRSYRQKRTVKALGFTKLHQSRLLEDNPSVQGMISKIVHLLEVEKIVTKPVKRTKKKTTKTKKETTDA